jgi:tetratricopeptide (TPR) repeat protein
MSPEPPPAPRADKDTAQLSDSAPDRPDPGPATSAEPDAPGPPAAAPPLSVPGYEILGELGRGGMGVVYRARQRRPGRVVALKMIQAGAHAHPADLARFRAEAEAIARLQHPNIVQIYEVGEVQGQPFFSLELCPGGTLARKLQGAPLPAREAARLTEILARAVHTAHQAHIVHRDLKPANVLLAADGTPKVTDFGLAKRLDQDGHTRTGAVLGTPAYMAPEQAAGRKEVGPAADVYALGAILYECLTGRPPFKAATPIDTLRQVLDDEPLSVRRLQRQAPRDLETICHKCLEKDPRKRYASAQALAEDLGCFLAGEPIHARPVAVWERGLKWARRRPAAALLLVALFLGAAGAAAGVLWHTTQLREANTQLADALGKAEEQRQNALRLARARERSQRQAADVIEDMLTYPSLQKILAGAPGMEQTRREILERALARLQDLLGEEPGDQEVRRHTAWAHARVGEVCRQLGRSDQAEKAFGHALAVQAALADEHPGEPSFRRDLALTYNNLGILLKDRGRLAEAEQAGRKAIALYEGLEADAPLNPATRDSLANSHNNLGIVLYLRGQVPEAEAAYRTALRLFQELARARPADPERRRKLALAHNNLGYLLAQARRREEAAAAYGEALKIFERLAADLPQVPAHRQDLAGALNNLGQLQAQIGQDGQAVKTFRRAVELREALVRDFPTRPDYRTELALSSLQLGGILWGRAVSTEAELLCRRAVDLDEQLATDFPAAAGYRGTLTYHATALVRGLVQMGRTADAERLCRYALAAADRLAARQKDRPEWPGLQADLHHALGDLRRRAGDLAGARKELEQAVAHRKAQRQARPEDPGFRKSLCEHFRLLAEVCLDGKDHAGAARAAAELPRVCPEGWQEHHRAARLLARCVPLAKGDAALPKARRHELAEQYAGEAVRLLRAAVDRGFPRLEELPRDPVFGPLRGRDDFQGLRGPGRPHP